MKTFLAIILLSATAFCQTYTFDFPFGKFQKASSFHLNSAGSFYITDSGNDKLYKYDTLGTYIEETGGYGWREAAFDNPVDVFATPLNIYVADKNNHRIQRFDKDLNFISQLSTRESENEDEQFGYPLACATSSQGDLFILDSENKRVIKFDLFGNYIQNFGGMDAGNFTLNNPTHLAVSASIKTFVADGKEIVVFDNYGNGLSKIETGLDLKGMKINFSYLTINTDNEIYFANLSAPEFELQQVNLIGMDYKPTIVTSIMQKNKIYVLTENEILVFPSVR
jgi:DNA-binding beta-propeller fold protein YncE